jgi:hypothetical protein
MRDFLEIIMEAQAPKPGFATTHRYPDGEVYHTEYDAPEEGTRVRDRNTGREGVMQGCEPSHHGEEYSPDCFVAWDDDQDPKTPETPYVARTTLAEIEPLEPAATSAAPMAEGRAGAFARLLMLERLNKPAETPVFKGKYHDVVPNSGKFDVIVRNTGKVVGTGYGSTAEAIGSAKLKDSRSDGEDVGANLRNLEVAESEHHEVVPKGTKFDIRDRSSGRTVGMGYDSEEAAEESAVLKDRRKNGEDVGNGMRNFDD